MGKTLQIRVTATTYDPDEVYRQWPGLSKLAWGDRRFTEARAVGVRELTAVLEDKWKFGEEWPRELKDLVGKAVPRLRELDAFLEDALADRRADKADGISYELEDALDELERLIK